MNIKKTFLFLLCLTFCSISYGQKFEKTDTITALMLDKKLAEKFRKGFRLQSADVENGVLRPLSGYEIIYLNGKKKFVIKPEGTLVPNTDKVDTREEGGITMVCHCGFGAGDDCEYYEVPQGPNTTNVYCGGGCVCADFYFIAFDDVLRVQTADGGY